MGVIEGIASSSSARLSQQPPALPGQKKLEVPDLELVGQLCCPPEPLLLEHFRVQRQQIVEVSSP